MRDEIVFLGTADGLPSAGRLHAAILLRLAGASILLDCGEPCSHTLKRRGEDFAAIDAVFLSHPHADHAGGLPLLLHAMRFEGRRRPLGLYLPRRAIRPLRAWLRHCLIDERRLGYRVDWRGISPRTPARVRRVSVAAFRTTHLDAVRARWGRRHPDLCYDAYAFVARGGGKRVAYSGDLGGAGDLAPLLRLPLDALITEASHLGAAQLAAALRGAQVGRVLVTHVAREAREARARWRGVGHLAADGEVVGF